MSQGTPPSAAGAARGEPLPSAALVILLYQSAEYVGPCLSSVAALERPPDELIVVDNASTDGSAELARQELAQLGLEGRVIALERNLGCCGGNNVGWRATHSDVVVFLNPDTEVTPTFLVELQRAMCDQPHVGIVGCRIYYPGTRRLQHAGGRVWPNGRTEHFGAGQEDAGQFEEPRDCDYVTGAGFAVRRSILEELGGFSGDFFPAYFEEVDLCTRARQRGWRVLYWPRAVMYHHESVSLGVESERFLRLYHRMRLRYCLRHLTLRQWLGGFLPEELRTLRRVSAVHRRAIYAAWRDALGWRLLRGRRAGSG
jgi:GT2 family glycosyltransferase